MSLLQLHKVSSSPWGKPLLADINLQLTGGEIHGVVGPNGAGKSTLLRCISGELPSTGDIQFQEQSLGVWEQRHKAQQLALLLQQTQLNFPFKVKEVVAMGRIPHDSGFQRDQQIVDEAMHAVDVHEMATQRYTQLSGGEKQRVQLARILAQVWDQQQPLLLMDEPTSALDLDHQQLLRNVLLQKRDQGWAIVVVLHDFNLLASLCDQVSVLQEGAVVAQGAPDKVFTAALFQQVFNSDVHIMNHPVEGYPVMMPV